MAETLSVRERIERRVLALVGAISGVGTVSRFSEFGNPTGHLDVVLIADDEDAQPGGHGPTDITTIQMTLVAELFIAQPQNGTEETTAFVISRWVRNIKAAILADPTLIEVATSEPLANWLRYVGLDRLSLTEHQSEIVVPIVFEIEYDEYTQNPDAAPGVTEQTD
tara:strand:- start:712 stop:1209 length:498 start_codon:yes stop_codon:yes gene_type:complete